MYAWLQQPPVPGKPAWQAMMRAVAYRPRLSFWPTSLSTLAGLKGLKGLTVCGRE